MSRTYWPTQTDRIDLRQTPFCPCSTYALPVHTNQDLVTQTKFASSCCPYYTVSSGLTSAGFSGGTYYRLVDSQGKSALFQSGGTLGTTLYTMTAVYSPKYTTKGATVMSVYKLPSGPTLAGLTITWSNEVCPCPSYG